MEDMYYKPPTNDNVNHPDHYDHGNHETIEVLRSWLNEDEFTGFCIGNTIKYLSRYKKKGWVEDLRKAAWYLDYILSVLPPEEDKND